MSPNTFFFIILPKKDKVKKFQIFDKKYRVTPYWKNENIQLFIINHFVV